TDDRRGARGSGGHCFASLPPPACDNFVIHDDQSVSFPPCYRCPKHMPAMVILYLQPSSGSSTPVLSNCLVRVYATIQNNRTPTSLAQATSCTTTGIPCAVLP